MGMSATERVINDLNVAKLMLCNPQILTPEMCIRIGQAITSAIALLKEQPEQKHGHWIEYPKCLEYDGALDDTYIVCSACEHVFNVIDNCTELFDYCSKCGAKMNEENEKEK